MSQDQYSRRVIAVAPMPPEKSAYDLARYSRSPDSIESSIKWVHGHSSEKFWDQFYFDYGHASIADLGHVIICFENISELAAIRLEDEPLWDGQAKSSRYQNFASGSWYIPDSLRGSELAPGRIHMVTGRVEKRLTLAEAKARRLEGQLKQIARARCSHRRWDRVPYLGGAGHYLRCAKCGWVRKAWGKYGDGPRKRDERAERHPDSAV